MSDEKHHQTSEDQHGDDMPEPGVMMLTHSTEERWPHYTFISLGLWLLSSPFMLGYQSAATTYSNLASGVLLIGLAVYALTFRNP